MAKIGGYKDLIAWQKSMALVEAVYKVGSGFPNQERFGMTAQVRRSVVSIPSNIAEGYGRRTRADYVRFVDIARGSANEVETQLLLAIRLGFSTPAQIEPVVVMVQEVQRILKGLVDSLERSDKVSVKG